MPGSSAHRPGKRWPASHYGGLAQWLAARGIVPVVVGTGSEAPLAGPIVAAAPGTIDLTGRTSLPELTELTRIASVAIGNDTGPMHLAAASGCPSIVLFSHDSDPKLCAPRGPWVRTLRAADLSSLPIDAVSALIADAPGPILSA